jgi:cytochrome P450
MNHPSAPTMFEFDPFDPVTIDDPFPVYRELRDRHPVYYNPRRGFWVISRHDDVQAVARDHESFSNAEGVDLDGTGTTFGRGNFLEMDNPRHAELRKVIRDWFLPAALRRLEGRVRTVADAIIDATLEAGSADLAQDLAWPLSIGMISQLIGIPESDRGTLQQWSVAALARDPGSPVIPDAALDPTERLRGYFADLLSERRQAPREDVASAIATATVGGEPLGDEGVGACLLVFVAGSDPPAQLMTDSFLLFEEHPDAFQGLQGQAAIEAAIEEILRFESPVQNLARVTTRDVELHGTVIPAGERVVLLYASANRDERRYEDPDRLDFQRPPKRHLAFGEGIHFCLGAPLARLEARIVLEGFLRRGVAYQKSGPVERLYKQNARGLARYPVVFS